ncbi:hypothetical protein [Sphingobium sp. Z007]|uniref:hypothetical protein n=1 Tax=Sphingobium sp. Z007 TaxID=627495 RepID=UPI001124E0C8|nr:hypothetical protein [Sphingobium sp. Z007]
MAVNKPITISYATPASDDAVSFNTIWVITLNGVSPTGSPVEAYLSISQNHRRKLLLSLENGLTWNDTDKSVHVLIRNGQLSFIRDDSEMGYEFWIVWDNTNLQRIAYGTVTAVRVD